MYEGCIDFMKKTTRKFIPDLVMMGFEKACHNEVSGYIYIRLLYFLAPLTVG
jgi:hypothetical protein